MTPTLPSCLVTSYGLRIPLFEAGTMPRTKIDALESYLLLTAWTQGELAEERFRVLAELTTLEHEWSHMDGWQGSQRTRTELAVEDAKRKLRPELYDLLTERKWIVKRLSEEIDRLEGDATKVSRVYTFITGS